MRSERQKETNVQGNNGPDALKLSFVFSLFWLSLLSPHYSSLYSAASAFMIAPVSSGRQMIRSGRYGSGWL
jgi:hypothetical protein